jgi:hypothetical protein
LHRVYVANLTVVDGFDVKLTLTKHTLKLKYPYTKELAWHHHNCKSDTFL